MCNTHLYLHLLHDLYILKNICLHIQTSKSNPTWQCSFSLLCKSIFWHQGTWLPTPWYTCSSDQIPSVRPTSHLWHPLGLTGASALPSCSGCDTSLCLRVSGGKEVGSSTLPRGRQNQHRGRGGGDRHCHSALEGECSPGEGGLRDAFNLPQWHLLSSHCQMEHSERLETESWRTGKLLFLLLLMFSPQVVSASLQPHGLQHTGGKPTGRHKERH